ncbi:MAG TPA: hypothetical protein VLK84_26790 [Longimicrobium sp.]|nr:hypothetical protein [Longimicrobium sp.]
MRHEADELWYGDTYLGRWKVISRPGAIIQAKVLEMPPEVWRDLTTTDPNYPPPKYKHSW